MLVYRISVKNYSNLLSAPGVAGRWNTSGCKLVYTAESIALAFLESMLRRKGLGFNDLFRTMVIRIPDSIKITVIPESKLAVNWRNSENYSACQFFGDDWYHNSDTLVLKAPSAILPQENNYIINSTHPDFNKIRLLGTTPLIPDKRIDDLLKKYPQD